MVRERWASLLIEAPVGEPERRLVYRDFVGWRKGLLFPSLGGLLYWGTWKMRSLRDTRNALRSGLPLYRGPLGNLEGVRLSGLSREINSISEYLFCVEAIQVLNLSEAKASLRQINLGSLFLGPEDNRKRSMGAIWNVVKGTWLL
jgi:hypothetical protein